MLFHSSLFTIASLCAIAYALVTVLNGQNRLTDLW